MNSLKEKKRLIDWEEELNFWIPGIELEEHFIEYTKMEAFEKFSIGNTLYGLDLSIKDFYQQVFSMYYNKIDDINYNSFEKNIMNMFQINNTVEKKDESIIDESVNKEDIVYSKNNLSKTLNTDFMIKKVKKNSLIKRNTKDSDSLINLNNCINVVGCNKKNNIKSKANLSFFEVFKINKAKKKDKKLKKNIIKSSFAVALSIITAVSSYGIVKSLSKVNIEDNRSSISSVVLNDNISNNVKTMRKCVIDKDIVQYSEKSNVAISNTKIKEKDIELKSEDSTQSKLMLGSMIKLNSKSKIFCRSSDCIKNNNGYSPYFSLDTDRYIKSVTFDYNGSIINSKNQKEIDSLLSKGAKILVIGTSINENSNIADEGYYNYKDAKVLCKSGVL